MAKEIRQIGVLTSGGDAPGMNAAIRAVAREAMHNKCKVIGIQRGYKGLLNEEFHEMKSINVAGIIHQGGTVLGTARCPEFKEPSVFPEPSTLTSPAPITRSVLTQLSTLRWKRSTRSRIHRPPTRDAVSSRLWDATPVISRSGAVSPTAQRIF